MKNFTHKTIQDLKDLFPEAKKKDFSGTVKNLKSLQNSFFPRTDFKNELKNRLKNIYEIDQNNVPSKFFLWQYIGIFTSFIFMTGVVFALYNNHMNNSQDDFLQQALREQNNSQTLSDTYMKKETGIEEQIGEISIQETYNENEQELGNNLEIQKQKKIIPEQQKSLKKQAELEPYSYPPLEKKQDTLGSHLNDGRLEGDSGFLPIETETSFSNDTFIDNDVMPMRMMVPETMMMDESMSENAEGISENERFIGEDEKQELYQICEDAGGVISEDGTLCILQQDYICSIDNIKKCIEEFKK